MTREEAITNIVMIRSVFLAHLTQEQREIIDNTFDMAIEALSAEPCEDCISRKKAIEISNWLIDNLDICEALKKLPGVQPKEIYNKGWKDGAKATAYHVELCEEENPTIPLSVIEDIKADIADFMAKIPALGNCKEGWHNAGQRIGLEQACEIIDNHIAERGTE